MASSTLDVVRGRDGARKIEDPIDADPDADPEPNVHTGAVNTGAWHTGAVNIGAWHIGAWHTGAGHIGAGECKGEAGDELTGKC